MTPRDQETGEPVELLREIQDDVSPEFLRRVRDSIERRRSTAQVVSFSWNLPAAAFWELLRFFGDLAHIHGRKGEKR
jgi:hypothetical protein